jgi:hypothetical protein
MESGLQGLALASRAIGSSSSRSFEPARVGSSSTGWFSPRFFANIETGIAADFLARTLRFHGKSPFQTIRAPCPLSANDADHHDGCIDIIEIAVTPAG